MIREKRMSRKRELLNLKVTIRVTRVCDPTLIRPLSTLAYT